MVHVRGENKWFLFIEPERNQQAANLRSDQDNSTAKFTGIINTSVVFIVSWEEARQRWNK